MVTESRSSTAGSPKLLSDLRATFPAERAAMNPRFLQELA